MVLCFFSYECLDVVFQLLNFVCTYLVLLSLQLLLLGQLLFVGARIAFDLLDPFLKFGILVLVGRLLRRKLLLMLVHLVETCLLEISYLVFLLLDLLLLLLDPLVEVADLNLAGVILLS